MRVALVYFGLTRSLRHTAASIACQIEAPLAEAGWEVRRVGHFHRPEVIDNPRSGERGIVQGPADTGLLGLDALTVEPQDPALIAADRATCRSGADAFGDDYRTLGNLCFQLRSLRLAWTLAAPWVGADDLVLFLRPDLHYLDRVETPALADAMRRGAADLLVPDWQHWGGLNDRFALCRATAAPAYADRADRLAEFVARNGAAHPERLLAHAVQAAGLRAGPMAARAIRIRADGRAAAQDLAWFGLVGGATPRRA